MTDVVVIGAGVVGAGIAWRAAQAGLDVAIVDDRPGRGASWVAAGMLAPVSEAHFGEERLLELTLASARRWPAFAEELAQASGRESSYRESGTLMVALDRDDLADLERLAAFQAELGLEVTRLRSRECRHREPLLSPAVRGGVLVAGDHAVDPRELGTALLLAAEAAGAKLVRERATEIVTGGGRVRGVRLASSGSELAAGQVVLAAGAWSAKIEGLPDAARPAVRPVKGQVLRLAPRAGAPSLGGNLRATARGRSVYLVPRGDGRVVVGATVEEQGFDTAVTAGGLRELLDAAAEVVPGIDELAVEETIAGLRPGTPDNAPLLGRAALDGLVIATGHYRNGVLLTPVTADEVARLLTGEDPELLRPFSPGRFASSGHAGQ